MQPSENDLNLVLSAIIAFCRINTQPFLIDVHVQYIFGILYVRNAIIFFLWLHVRSCLYALQVCPVPLSSVAIICFWMHIYKRTGLYLILFLPEILGITAMPQFAWRQNRKAKTSLKICDAAPTQGARIFLKHTVFLILKKVTLREQTFPIGIKA